MYFTHQRPGQSSAKPDPDQLIGLHLSQRADLKQCHVVVAERPNQQTWRLACPRGGEHPDGFTAKPSKSESQYSRRGSIQPLQIINCDNQRAFRDGDTQRVRGGDRYRGMVSHQRAGVHNAKRVLKRLPLGTRQPGDLHFESVEEILESGVGKLRLELSGACHQDPRGPRGDAGAVGPQGRLADSGRTLKHHCGSPGPNCADKTFKGRALGLVTDHKIALALVAPAHHDLAPRRSFELQDAPTAACGDSASGTRRARRWSTHNALYELGRCVQRRHLLDVRRDTRQSVRYAAMT